MPRRTAIAALLALVSAGCAATVEPAPAVGPEPDTAAEEMELDATPEPMVPEPSLQERWRAPFAVTSRGRPAVRPERPVLAVTGNQADTVAARIPERVDAPTPDQPEGERPDPDSLAAPEARDELDPAATQKSPEPPAEAAAGGLRTHRVEWGETWFGLSRRYGVSSAALARLNPGVDPAQLRAGEVLLIPPADTADPDVRRHTVGAGDSLWGISRRYGVSIERLREANRLTDDRVRIGQVLIIP